MSEKKRKGSLDKRMLVCVICSIFVLIRDQYSFEMDENDKKNESRKYTSFLLPESIMSGYSKSHKSKLIKLKTTSIFYMYNPALTTKVKTKIKSFFYKRKIKCRNKQLSD